MHTAPGSGYRTKTRIVLFAEDNADVRELYALAMRNAGLAVVEVTSVAEAMQIAPRLCADLVILDRHLSDGDGWDVARAVKASPITKHASIIGFTASKGRGDVEGALVAGCDAFVEKPCTPEQLVRLALGLLELPLPEDEDAPSTIIRKLA